jgi:hypothetical protein
VLAHFCCVQKDGGARELRDGVCCLTINGAQFLLSSDDKTQSALFVKKLGKKIAAMKEHLK